MSLDGGHQPDEFPTDLKPFEAAIGSLVPVAGRIDRDRLMYQAGAARATAAASQRTGRLPQMFWPCAAAAMLLLALGFGAELALRQPQERIVFVDRPATISDLASAPLIAPQLTFPEAQLASESHSTAESYLILRERALRLGVDSLDEPPSGGGPASSEDLRNRALLNQFLGS